MAAATWIPEEKAAEKISRQPRTLRKAVKSGALPIAYTNINGRGFLYNEKDIDKLLVQNSTLTSSK